MTSVPRSHPRCRFELDVAVLSWQQHGTLELQRYHIGAADPPSGIRRCIIQKDLPALVGTGGSNLMRLLDILADKGFMNGGSMKATAGRG
jgi:hypothetical protein